MSWIEEYERELLERAAEREERFAEWLLQHGDRGGAELALSTAEMLRRRAEGW